MLLSNFQYAKIAKLTACEQEIAADKFWRNITKNKTPSSKKQLIILVGQPGSGKSTLADKYQQKNSNLVCVGGDDILRYHPRLFQMAQARPVRLNSKMRDCYDDPVFSNPKQDPLDYNNGERYLEEFAHDTYIKTVCGLFEQGYDILIDALPGDEAKAFTALGNRLGYSVNVVAVVVPKQISDSNIVKRFEKGTKLFHEAIAGKREQSAENVPHTYNRLRQHPDDLEDAQNFLLDIVKSGFALQVVNPINKKIIGEGEKGALAYLPEIKRTELTVAEQELITSRYTDITSMQEERGASKYDRILLNTVTKGYQK